MSERMDDFDVEVSGLEQATAAPPADAHHPDGASPPLDTIGADSPAPVAQRLSLSARLPRPQRLLRAGSVVALLILLVCAVLLIPTSNRDAVLHLLTPPTAVPTAIPRAGDDAFLWEHSVPWGQLFIDGKPGPDVRGSAEQFDAQGFPDGALFHLLRGRHFLEYRAYPFPTLACRVSVPASRDDTCPLAPFDVGFLGGRAPATRLLDLQATIDRLPRVYLEPLLATTQAYLDSLSSALPSGALSVGDHYLDRAGQVTQARSALQIKAQFRLDSSVEQLNGVSCVTLCAATGLGESSSPEGWALLAPVALTWRYTTPSGEVVASDGPALPLGAVPFNAILLRVGWSDGAWQTPTAVLSASETDPVICPTGAHALNVTQASTSSLHSQWPVAVSTAELGCLLAGSDTDPTSGIPTGPLALVLYRAGALVAVNVQAQQNFPNLPMASAHERALALAVAPASLP
jgi:hypothetical protein